MNLLLYVVDCLRADHVHALGYGRSTTPVIDGLARDGAVLANFYAQGGWTAPSAASLLSGESPSRTGIHCMRDRLAPDVVWLPERLRDAGYETAAFSAMIQVSSLTGFERGFDTFGELFRDREVAARCAARGQDVRGADYCLPLSEDLHERALRWLDARDRARPFFLFLWSIDTHEPFRQPARCNVDCAPDYRGPIDGRGRPFRQVRNARDRQQVIDLYDGALRYQDEQLGRLIESLRARGVLDDTLLVVTGDHGEMFWEHGLAGHGKFPWEQELRVPCVLRAPRCIRPGTRVSALASNADLAPTILDLVGLARDEPGAGPSLRACLEGRASEVHEHVVLEVPSPFDRRESARVVRRGAWKYVETTAASPSRRARRCAQELGRLAAALARPGSLPLLYGARGEHARDAAAAAFGGARRRLFDLASDPRELRDLARREPALANEMAELVRRPESTARAAEATTRPGGEAERAIRDQLARLGYLDE